MKKTGLFVVLLTMCGGLAAQNIEVSSDSVKNEVDSLSVTASMDSLRTPLEKKVVPVVKKKVELPPLEVRNFGGCCKISVRIIMPSWSAGTIFTC